MENKRCPKCGYVHYIENRSNSSPLECPRCGIIYEKYDACLARKQANEEDEIDCQQQDEQDQMQGIQLSLEPRGKRISLMNRLLIQPLLKSLRQNETLTQCISSFKECPFIQWLIRHRDTLAAILFRLWIGGCIYWLYRFIMTDIRAQHLWAGFIDMSTIDSKDALTFLFFGSMACFFLLGLGIFVTKFLFNLLLEGVCCYFPREWHSLIASIIFLVLLSLSFPFIREAKVAGLSAYQQVNLLIQRANDHKVIIVTKPSKSTEIIETEAIRHVP